MYALCDMNGQADFFFLNLELLFLNDILLLYSLYNKIFYSFYVFLRKIPYFSQISSTLLVQEAKSTLHVVNHYHYLRMTKVVF